MIWRPTRYFALAIVVLLLAAQVHLFVECGRPTQASRHACQFCLSGGWAILSSPLALEVKSLELRLEAQPRCLVAVRQQSDASAPRAPPLA